MIRRILSVAVLLLVIGVKPILAQGHGHLPLAFEPNQGQADGRVRFLSRGSGYTLFLTESGAVLTLDDTAGTTIRAMIVGARPARIEGADPLPGQSNYFIGNDPRRWRAGVPHFGKVRYGGIYPGIDLVFYGNQRQLEYDFVVAPRRSPATIKLAFDGTQSLRLDASGDLIVGTSGLPIRMRRPIAYQQIAGARRDVAVRYRVIRGDAIGFDVGAYDRDLPLVIDPVVLVQSSYLGGFGWDEPNDLAVDGAGNSYVTGLTEGRGFPVTPGGQLTSSVSTVNAFVTKIDPSGSSVVYSTIFGGSGFDNAYAIAVDASGAAVIGGGTGSADFPIVGGLQTGLNGADDAFLVKLAPNGASFTYSTLIGGAGSEQINDVVIALSADVYVTGRTDSVDFPVNSAVQPTFAGGLADGFAAKLTADASHLVYATYLGGSGEDSGSSLAVDTTGSMVLAGGTTSADFPTANAVLPAYNAGSGGTFYPDAFVTKLSPDGSSLVYSTYLGGSTWDGAGGIAVDASGNAYVTGFTDSWEFPRVGGIPRTNFSAYPDAYVTKFARTGALLFSTTLGGSQWDVGGNIALDPDGNIWIAGWTDSGDFPVKSPFQSTFAGGWDDGFIAKLSPEGSSLLAATYFGGSAHEYIAGLAIDTDGSVLITGATSSPDLPVLNAFQPALAATPDQQGSQSGLDAFVSKLTLEPDPALVANAGADVIVPANASCSGQVTLDGTGSTAPPDRYIQAYVWTGPNQFYAEGPTPTFPLAPIGTYTFELTVYDDLWNRATDSVTATLADLTGPHVGSIAATPGILWPPNRQMVPVTVTVADVSDACSGKVTCHIESVSSNEPLAPGDFVITGALTVDLRADRLGEGTGRVYTITVACADGSGNVTRKTVTVLVPHDL